MKVYQFNKDSAREVTRSRIISRIPVIMIAAAGGLFLANYQSDGIVFGNSLVLILTVIVSIIAIFIGLLLGLKLETNTLMQNQYSVGEDFIEWRSPSGKNIKMHFGQINSHKLSDKGLLIACQGDKMLIPSKLPLFNELSSHILSQVNERVLKA